MINKAELSDVFDYREKIDALDAEIAELIQERFDCVSALLSIKDSLRLPAWDQKRVDQVIDNYVENLGEHIDGIKIAQAIIGDRDDIERLINGD